MNSLPAHLWHGWLSFAGAALALQLVAPCEPIPARHLEGTAHGFLSLSTQDGKVLAVGDLLQIERGDRITSHLVFHFKDGSIDDETADFTQRGTFHLIRDHHVQKGPFFPHPQDLSIDVPSGEVNVRSIGKDGKEEIKTEHLDLPSDLYNGMVTTIVKNVYPDTPETTVSMLVATPKPRIVKLAIHPQCKRTISITGFPRDSLVFQIKIELGGISGVVAPLIGKQPPDIDMCIVEGDVPTFIREEGPIYEGSPVLRIDLASPERPSSSGSSK